VIGAQDALLSDNQVWRARMDIGAGAPDSRADAAARRLPFERTTREQP